MRRAARNGLRAASWAAAYSSCLVSMWGLTKNFEANFMEMRVSVNAYSEDTQDKESQSLNNAELKKAVREKDLESLPWHVGAVALMIAGIAGGIKVYRTPRETAAAAEDAIIIPLPVQDNSEAVPEHEYLAKVLHLRREADAQSGSSQAS